jgi:hypothetical protein
MLNALREIHAADAAIKQAARFLSEALSTRYQQSDRKGGSGVLG